MLILITLLVLFGLALYNYKKLLKFRKPLYIYRGNYEQVHLGEGSKYFTEYVTFSADEIISSSDLKPKYPLVFLFFCGNPGYLRFYDRFLSHLSIKMNKKFDVIGVGQAGQSLDNCSNYQKYFNLIEQVEHKELFFKYLLKKAAYNKAKFVFIGHSFGCYTAMKLMRTLNKDLIEQALFIHPAIHRLVETPNGKHRMGLHQYGRQLNIGLKVLTSGIFPTSLMRFLSQFAFQSPQKAEEDIDDCVETLSNWMLNYDCVKSFLDLTLFQFMEMNEIDEDDINTIAGKLTIIYTQDDDWTPQGHMNEIENKFQHKVEIYKCEQDLTHTFVAGASNIQADICLALLRKKITNI